MDDQEAKLRLAVGRPEGQDDDDPALTEAMRQMRGNAELAEWFARQRSADQQIALKLAEVPMPEGLRERILTGRKMTSKSGWQSRSFWLAAAAVLLAFVSAWFLAVPGGVKNQKPAAVATLQEYRDDVAATFLKIHDDQFELDLEHSDSAKVRSWLAEQGAPVGGELRAGLKSARAFGCKVIEWRGRRVSMMCFGKNKDQAHLFVVDRSAISGTGGIVDDRDHVQRVSGLQVVTWQDEHQAYVLVANTASSDLGPFL